nr:MULTISPECIES: transposase [unclassified Sphingobium]
MRRDLENQARNIMKTTGAMLGSPAGRGLAQRVQAARDGNPALTAMCGPLLTVVQSIRDQIRAYDRLLLNMARRDETARRLMTVPGVGALTSLAFMRAVDDPSSLRRSSDVGAYLALTPDDINPARWTGPAASRNWETGSREPTCSRRHPFSSAGSSDGPP